MGLTESVMKRPFQKDHKTSESQQKRSAHQLNKEQQQIKEAIDQQQKNKNKDISVPASSRSRPILIPLKDSSSLSDSCGIDTLSPNSDFSTDDDERGKLTSKEELKTLESRLLNNVHISRFHHRYLSERILAPKLYYEKTKSNSQNSLEHSISMFAIIYLPNWRSIYNTIFLFPPSKSEEIFFNNFHREHPNIDTNDLEILSMFFTKRAKTVHLFEKLKSSSDPLGVNHSVISFRRFSELIYFSRDKSVDNSKKDAKGCEMSCLRRELEEVRPPFRQIPLKHLISHYIIVHYPNYQEIWDENFPMLTRRLQNSIATFLMEYPMIDASFLAMFDVRGETVDKAEKRKEIDILGSSSTCPLRGNRDHERSLLGLATFSQYDQSLC